MCASRPGVWVGHVLATYRDLDLSAQFWTDIGLRPVQRNAQVAIFELRGGTHLILVPGAEPNGETAAAFDLMVDDLEAEHRRLTGEGFRPSPIDRNENHRWFALTDPGGNVVTFNDSHVIGPV